jgi:hypothetical protein
MHFGGHYGARFHPGDGFEIGVKIGYERGTLMLGLDLLIP